MKAIKDEIINHLIKSWMLIENKDKYRKEEYKERVDQSIKHIKAAIKLLNTL